MTHPDGPAGLSAEQVEDMWVRMQDGGSLSVSAVANLCSDYIQQRKELVSLRASHTEYRAIMERLDAFLTKQGDSGETDYGYVVGVEDRVYRVVDALRTQLAQVAAERDLLVEACIYIVNPRNYCLICEHFPQGDDDLHDDDCPLADLPGRAKEREERATTSTCSRCTTRHAEMRNSARGTNRGATGPTSGQPGGSRETMTVCTPLGPFRGQECNLPLGHPGSHRPSLAQPAPAEQPCEHRVRRPFAHFSIGAAHKPVRFDIPVTPANCGISVYVKRGNVEAARVVAEHIAATFNDSLPAAVEALPEKWKEYGRLAEAAQVATYSELRSAVYYKCARELLKALGKAKEGGE